MRSLSASIMSSRSRCRQLSARLGQGGAAGDRLRAVPADHRAGRRRLAGAQRVEQRLGRGAVEILVEIVVDLQDRRVDAGAETFDLDQGEQAVGGRLADADAELALAGADHLVRAAQPARRRRAGLQQIAPDRPQIEHRVEARRPRRPGSAPCRASRRRSPSPRAAASRRIGAAPDRAAAAPRSPAAPAGIWRYAPSPPRKFSGVNSKLAGCSNSAAFAGRAHRSISPKTMSIEPMIATTSASMWPRHMKSVACRKAKPGARILQR